MSSNNTSIGTNMIETIVVQSDLGYEYMHWSQNEAQITFQTEIIQQPQIQEITNIQHQQLSDDTGNFMVDISCRNNQMEKTCPFLQQMGKTKQRLIFELLGLLDSKNVYEKLKSLGRFDRNMLSNPKNRQIFRKIAKRQQIKIDPIATKIVSKIHTLRARLGLKKRIVKEL